MDERIEKIVGSPIFAPVIVGILAFSAGVVGGYHLGRRGKFHLRSKKEPVMSPEIMAAIERSRAVRESIGKIDRSEPISSREEFEKEIEGLVTPDEDITVSIRPVPDDDGDVTTIIVQGEFPPPEPPVEHKIFAGNVPNWDYEEEMKTRTEDKPYVIHRDEFYEEQRDYCQTTLTYYEGDNIMVDEEDVPVYNFEDVVGLLKFGHGTDDPNVFHVRNDHLNAEYEVLYDPGHYSVEILGLEHDNEKDPDEEKHLKHSTDHVRRFRSDD
jgi:hypothetical protein